MRSVIIGLLLIFAVSSVNAAQWTTLQDNKHARLMLDKQSITTSGQYQKAWVDILYKSLQTNMQYPEKSYNNAKLLWYFKCAEQQSATSQVYQMLNEELVYSAAIDIKRARFLEPVPETEADIAMHYVCEQKKREQAEAERKARAKEVTKNKPIVAEKAPVKKDTPAVPVTPEPVPNDAPTKEMVTVKEKGGAEKPVEQLIAKVEEKSAKNDEVIKDAERKATDTDKPEDKKTITKKKRRAAQWRYIGSKGPAFWGELSPDYISCETGRNQSPINIDKTISTTPKPLKTFQRFPVEDIANTGKTIQASFKTGNIMVVDSVMYQMKQVHFHAPSENQIMGKSYPLEAHFDHVDPNGNVAVLAVMFDEGVENKALAKLWRQMPKRKGKPKKLSTKVLAGELIPRQKEYYRFSGSMTTPPCSEGVVWIVMKKPMTASKQQIAAFKKVMKYDNNRPIQPLHGRMVVE